MHQSKWGPRGFNVFYKYADGAFQIEVRHTDGRLAAKGVQDGRSMKVTLDGDLSKAHQKEIVDTCEGHLLAFLDGRI